MGRIPCRERIRTSPKQFQCSTADNVKLKRLEALPDTAIKLQSTNDETRRASPSVEDESERYRARLFIVFPDEHEYYLSLYII